MFTGLTDAFAADPVSSGYDSVGNTVDEAAKDRAQYKKEKGNVNDQDIISTQIHFPLTHLSSITPSLQSISMIIVPSSP